MQDEGGVFVPTTGGRYFPLSLPRRWIGDLLYFARQVPSVPVERVMHLNMIRTERERVGISWPALFLKGFGLAAQQHPELRRSILKYPWNRCYEHPSSIASVAIERNYQGEPAVFFAQIMGPETHSIKSIEQHLRKYKCEPIEKFGHFRRVIWMAKFPMWLRRFGWWISLHWVGEKRAKRLGTFGLSTYSSLGASSTHPLSPSSFLLNYGVIDDAGRVTVRLIYDHRIVDGAVVARALATMETCLTGPVLSELKLLQSASRGGNEHTKETNDKLAA